MTPILPAMNFTWRVTNDAARVHAIHSTVIAKTPKGMVRPDSMAHFESHMGERGQTLGCFLDDGEMVAYGVLGVHSPTVEHLAHMLGADQSRFCVLDGASSLPEWRGYRLHYSVIDERIRHAGAIGRTLVGATVAPENIRSIRGLMHAGMVVRCFAYLYGGLARLVVMRDMQLDAPDWQHAGSISVADHDSHKAALADGLHGYACNQAPSGAWLIDYGIAR